ncbi:MAG: SH3 domain-containing protein [Candidatus Symbiodolus clandestinus]
MYSFIVRCFLMIALLIPSINSYAGPLETHAKKSAAPLYFFSQLQSVSQNAVDYLSKDLAPSKRLLSEAAQQQLTDTFLQHYFSPWHSQGHFSSLEEIKQQQLELLKEFSQQPSWGANHYPIAPTVITAIEQNLDLAHFPNRRLPAITLQSGNVKQLPTSTLLLGEPGTPGSGYPFDNNQETWISSNTPVLIVHTTEDAAWSLVLLGNTFGWLPSWQLAAIDEKFRLQWQTPPQGHLTISTLHCPLVDNQGQLVTVAELGGLYPVIAEKPDRWLLYAATRDRQGAVVLQPITIKKAEASRFPCPLTPSYLATTINQLVGQPYRWGGLDGSYDCSSILITLFQPFGIWLPRNSGDQAKRAQHFIDLADFDRQKKLELIQKRGIPFLTLGWMPGHIVLYLGQKQNPHLFHSVWGLKTIDAENQSTGRALIGRAAIMPLQVDADYLNIPITLLDKLQRLIIVTDNNYPIQK